MLLLPIHVAATVLLVLTIKRRNFAFVFGK